MTFIYEVINSEVAISPDMLGLEDSDTRTRAKHRFKLKTKKGRTDELKHSFVNRSIPEWNLLPATVAEAASLHIFKRQLVAQLP